MGAKFKFDGEKLTEKNKTTSKIRKTKDIDNEIDGPGEEVKAALWFYFCQ